MIPTSVPYVHHWKVLFHVTYVSVVSLCSCVALLTTTLLSHRNKNQFADSDHTISFRNSFAVDFVDATPTHVYLDIIQSKEAKPRFMPSFRCGMTD